ncbi:MAG: outer membrane beta-barrel family protein [Paludibacteraceae bacterium]|nr:outer membrane beta-barrel family protein [Paludibacteraceae bacterium]
MNKLFTILLLLCPAVLFGQGFGGSIDVNGSYNFIKGHTENLDLELNYDTTKWYIHTDISGGHKYWTTETEKFSASGTKEFWNHIDGLNQSDIYKAVQKGYITKGSYDYTKDNKRGWNGGAGVDIGVNITPKDVLSAYFRYDYYGNKNNSITNSGKLDLSGKEPDIKIDSIMGHQDENYKFSSHQIDSHIKYNHDFNVQGRNLWVQFSTFMSFDREEKERSLHNDRGTYYKEEKRYKAPSNLNDLNYLYQIYYEDKNLFTAPGLKGSLGIDVKQNNEMDFYWRKDYINGQWLDDKSKTQGYWYYSLAVEPVIKLDYSIYKFDFGVENRLQWFTHALTPDMAEGKSLDSIKVSFKNNEWRDMVRAYIGYKPADRHKLQVSYNRNIIRPTYDKLTSMIKVGNTESEYFTGNPNLKPQINNAVDLKYTYTFKQNFELYALLKYTHTRDKAEKVVDNTTTDGITYYTYINAGIQQQASARVDLKGTWEHFTMEIYGQTNIEFISYKNNLKATKTTVNYEIFADLKWKLPQGWGINLKGGYASRKETAYSAKDSYIQTNLRFSKTFFDKLDLYIEGRDLGDFNQYEYTWNETLDYCKISRTANHRIALAIGLKYNF